MARYEFMTKVGTLALYPMGKHHIVVHFGEKEPIVVNGVGYRGDAHMYCWSDGCYRLGEETENPVEQRTNLYIRRADYSKYIHISDAAYRKMRAIITSAVAEWVTFNPIVIKEAELEHLKRELDKRLEEVRKLEAQARKLQAQADDLWVEVGKLAKHLERADEGSNNENT
jgi:hypothetical protein